MSGRRTPDPRDVARLAAERINTRWHAEPRPEPPSAKEAVLLAGWLDEAGGHKVRARDLRLFAVEVVHGRDPGPELTPAAVDAWRLVAVLATYPGAPPLPPGLRATIDPLTHGD